MIIRFGLYFIPEGDLYERGTQIVGYDIRKQQTTKQPDFIEKSWTKKNEQFGFHSTVTDAIDIDEAKLPLVIDKTTELLSCLRPANSYAYTVERVGFWRPNSGHAVILMKPSRHVELLHDVLVSTLHPLGVGSEYYKIYSQDPAAYVPNTPVDLQRVQSFYSPYIFDDFAPHFTCMATGPLEERAGIEAQLQEHFHGIKEITMDKICLVTQREGDAHFRIVKEFSLHG